MTLDLRQRIEACCPCRNHDTCLCVSSSDDLDFRLCQCCLYGREQQKYMGRLIPLCDCLWSGHVLAAEIQEPPAPLPEEESAFTDWLEDLCESVESPLWADDQWRGRVFYRWLARRVLADRKAAVEAALAEERRKK